MKLTDTEIPDVKIIQPIVYCDERGFFYESYNHDAFQRAIGCEVNFVQDNHSKSEKGVLRGLHYQLEPHAQGKLVRVIQGEVFDVAVDIRPASQTFGNWVGVVLSSENKKQLWIPKGFAHGFLTLSEVAEFCYKTTSYYNKDAERVILWSDKDINILWPKNISVSLSQKDSNAKSFFHSVKKC